MYFEIVIGFEVYVELKMDLKMFFLLFVYFGVELNLNINVIDLVYLGVLLVVNRCVVDWVMRVLMVLNMDIVINLKFDCKNYFYLDNLKVY